MKTLAHVDTLTGLYNQKGFYKFCQDILDNTNEDEQVSIVIVEVGQLKQLNYQYDHASGDKVIIEVAKLLEQNFRDADICSRLGGQKFAIICPNSNFVESPKILLRLYEAIEALSVVHNDAAVDFSVSIGATTKTICNDVDRIAAIEQMISAANLMVIEAQSNQLQLSSNYS